jgi:PilZ domain
VSARFPASPPSSFVDDFPEGRRIAPRRKVTLPVSLRFDDESNIQATTPTTTRLIGETRDLSEIGLAVSLPTNHIDGRYLNVVGARVQLALDLPAGTIQMAVTPRWCKKICEEEVESYLVGFRITRMSDRDWAGFVRYVRKFPFDSP